MTCEDCQLACYDLLDRHLSVKGEREVLAHVESCSLCRAFLEEEGNRMRAWPRLLSVATRHTEWPTDAAERVAHALEVSLGSGSSRKRATWGPGRLFRRPLRWIALAASVLVLASLGGAAVCLMKARLQRDGVDVGVANAVMEADPVLRLLGQKQVKGLDIPEALPGLLKLAEGEIVVRLQTGVELTLLGPATVDIRDSMRVDLQQGRLFARVPLWAVGFTVRTRELEVYDLGTVFGVSVDESVTDVFVFKGRVQVNETGEGVAGTLMSGARVDICEAGEGVQAKAGAIPVRFRADSAVAQMAFKQIKGCAALKNPSQTWQAVREIADSWAELHRPGSSLAAKSRPNGNGTLPRHQPCVLSSVTAATGGGEHTCPAAGTSDTAQLAGCGFQTTGMVAVTNAQATDLYFAAGNGGDAAWDTTGDWRVYQCSGGGYSGRLPASNDTVRINAATLAVENGSALVVGTGVNAQCGSFASGYKEYPGTACLRLEGGALTSRTTTVIGLHYPGLAILESGTLHSGMDFYIGGCGDTGNARGVVTNNGATIAALRLHVGHEAGTFGRLVHHGGCLDCRPDDRQSSLQIGYNGSVGEFEAYANFSTYAMGIGCRSATSSSPGTGTVTVAEGAVGTVNGLLQISNGALLMKGGTLCFRVSPGAFTNLYVRQDADCQALIRGWGSLTCSDQDKPLRMINNGQIIADGEGVERDLDFNQADVVNHDFHNSSRGVSGWYAVHKGRVVFPCCEQTFLPATTYCWGDLYTKTVPELVNSVAFTFSSPITCAVRGGFCASDRSDIPTGLPEHLRPVGVWCIGAYSGKVLLTRASVPHVSLTFRYDHTRLKATDRKLRLYRYDGRSWLQVGSCSPGSGNRISADAPLAPVASGDYNIGWFALMAAESNGTSISIF